MTKTYDRVMAEAYRAGYRGNKWEALVVYGKPHAGMPSWCPPDELVAANEANADPGPQRPTDTDAIEA